MKWRQPVVILLIHLAIISLAAFLAGNFSVDGFVLLYGIFGIFAAAFDILISIGFAFTKNAREYIPGFLLSAAVLIITALFSLSQVEFSR